MMKKPEEIKKWMECCSIIPPKCNECPANIENSLCDISMLRSTLAYIQQLERERDAAVEILRSMHCGTCIYDEHYPIPNVCFDCIEYCNWEWRGVKDENDGN